MTMRKILIGLTSLLLVFIFYAAYRFGGSYQRKLTKENFVASSVSTASPSVRFFKDSLKLDFLGETRTLNLYLPPGYDSASTSYPVLYFMDGEALFDETVCNCPEWQVDEILDELALGDGPQAIVVGVGNGNNRDNEYKPFPSKEFPEAYGHKYVKWLATELKPWVDATFRTLPEPKHTTIGGISLSGLMAYYTLTTYPDVFGNGLVFSPSVWVSRDKVVALHEQVADWPDKRVYISVGEFEGRNMVKDARRMRDILESTGIHADNLYFEEIPNESHWNMTWRKGMRRALPFLLEERN
jgi:predicted alpha/beta superfamily hydrolase